MTRENKLALVVGFALILFVGILVSDHFSIARSQEAANLVPASDIARDPILHDPDLLEFAEPKPKRSALEHPPLVRPRRTTDDGPRSPRADTSDDEIPVIRMPNLLDPLNDPAVRGGGSSAGRIGLPDDEARRLPFRFHHVERGESLSSICERFYGDQSLARDLARFNDIGDPDLVPAGRRLKIPGADQLLGRASAPATRDGDATPASTPRPANAAALTYTVRSGDVLSVIAQEQLGSARHWRRLYEHNRDVIDDPDHLEVGVVLELPSIP